MVAGLSPGDFVLDEDPPPFDFCPVFFVFFVAN